MLTPLCNTIFYVSCISIKKKKRNTDSQALLQTYRICLLTSDHLHQNSAAWGLGLQ